MRLPVPTRSEVRFSFWVVGIAALMVTAALCYSFVQRVQQADDLVHIAERNADQVERLNRQIDEQAAESTAQRQALLDQNAQLLQQNRESARVLRGLMRYLRSIGIEVPETLLSPSPKTAPKTTTPGTSGSSRPKGTPRPKAAGTPAPSPRPGSPGATATPTPTPLLGPLGGVDLGPLCDAAPTLCLP
jgi:hypothetical protein